MVRSTSYKKITMQNRQKLIDFVEKDKISIKKSAKLLDLHYSTAKNIVRVFRQEERVARK